MKDKQTFESAIHRLEEIVRLLESSEVTLEEGLALYKEGSLCSRFCKEKLEAARHELEIWRDGKAEPLADLPQEDK